MTERMSRAALNAQSEYHRQWRAKNREKVRVYSAKWRAQNPEKAKEYRIRHWNKVAEKLSAESALESMEDT